ncbi:MAG: hypothetical protein KGJ30_13470, partial [Burkholderiales bacterium]|nr:hypothetical protein [Burkholderiales bacterium]
GAAVAAALALAGCGGGDVAYPVGFDLGVYVAGQPLAGVTISPGATQSIAIYAGQSIELDASQPVDWTLWVGGSAVTGSATVYYGGLSITQTTVSASRIAVDTAANYALPAPVTITFVATSSYDSSLVATVNVTIGN